MVAPPDISTLYKSDVGLARAMAAYDRMLGQFTVPYETQFVETPFGTTHVLLAGPVDAPVVALWHGLDASAPTWVAQINVLAQQYRICAPDVPGSMGKSAPDRLDRKGLAYGQWMAATLDALDIPQAHMIGISNGGWLILKLAMADPQKITSAVLISSAGFVTPDWKLMPRMLPMLIANRFLKPEQSAAYFNRVMGTPGLEATPDDLEMFAILLGYFKFEQAPGPLTDNEIRILSAPTCLLMGEHEAAFTPHKVVERAHRVLPSLQHAEIVPGVGHGMIGENPALVNEKLLAFLEMQSRQ